MNNENKSTEPKKLYEWVKATPDNLPNDKDSNGAVLIMIRWFEFGKYNLKIRLLTVNQFKDLLKNEGHVFEFEYLREYESELAAKAGLQGAEPIARTPNGEPLTKDWVIDGLQKSKPLGGKIFFREDVLFAMDFWRIQKHLPETLQPLGVWPSEEAMIGFAEFVLHSDGNKIQAYYDGEYSFKEWLSEYKNKKS